MFVSAALPAPGLAQTFSLVIAGLCRATASHIAIDRFAGPLLVRIFTRLHRLAARLTSLVARIEAGSLPPPPPTRPTAGRPTRRKPRLPESSGWLVRVVPRTAAYAAQVQALLDDPQTTALLQAAPHAGRILRPLCRMLAIPLPENLRRPRRQADPPPAADAAVEPPPAASPFRPTPPLRATGLTPRRATLGAALPPLPD
jgi:hypothetical protein